MATEGPRFPGTTANLSNAGTSENAEAWVNPGNVVSDNATEAQITAATYDSPDISQILVVSNFGFTAATGTIDGITVEIDRRSIIASSGKDFRVQLGKGTAFANLVGTNKAVPATIWPTTSTVATYGGSADLWGTTWTAAEVKASSFAVFISCQANIANADVGIDFVRVTITYTDASVTVTPTTASTAIATFAPTVTATVGLPVTDDFTAADGTLLGAHTGDQGFTYDLDTSTAWSITSNRAVPGTAGGRAIVVGVIGSADIDLSADINLGADGTSRALGFRFRRQDHDNFLWVNARRGSSGATHIELWQRVASTNTRLEQTFFTDLFVANTTYAFRVTAIGSTITAYVDGVQKVQYTGVTQFQTETSFGFHHAESLATGSSLDNFSASVATGNQVVTPTTATLATAAFAPTVATPTTVTPSTAALTSAAFAPTVSTPTTVTPSTAATSTTTFAPTITATDNQVVTPTTATLATATFAPSVAATANQVVTPTTATLATAAFAPDVAATANQVVTPAAATLATAAFAPTVSATDAQVVTPTTAALTSAAFAPTVDVSDASAIVVPAASLATSAFAPDVTASAHRILIPGTAALVLAAFAPDLGEPVVPLPRKSALGVAIVRPPVEVSYSPTPALGVVVQDSEIEVTIR